MGFPVRYPISMSKHNHSDNHSNPRVSTPIHGNQLRSMRSEHNHDLAAKWRWGKKSTKRFDLKWIGGREVGLRRSAVWVWGGWRHESEANPWLEAADGLVMSRFGGGDVEDESGRRRWIRELKRVTLREFAWESFERWWELQYWEREIGAEWLREREPFLLF